MREEAPNERMSDGTSKGKQVLKRIYAFLLRMPVAMRLALPLLLVVGVAVAMWVAMASRQPVIGPLMTPEQSEGPTDESPTDESDSKEKSKTDTKKKTEKKPTPSPGTSGGSGGSSSGGTGSDSGSGGGSSGGSSGGGAGGDGDDGGGGSTPPPSSSFPNASNTGVPSGTTLTTYAGPANNSTSNTVFENLNFPTAGSPGYYIFSGSNITVRNSYIRSGILFTGDNITIERNTIEGGASLSGTTGVNMTRNNIKKFAGDGLHITADSGAVSGVSVTNNYINTPTPQCGDHTDGIQVRGTTGLTIRGNTVNLGTWFQVCGLNTLNAAVFLEDDNGGNSNVTIDKNYLNGGGFLLQLNTGSNLKITSNAFGADREFGYVQDDTNPGDITDKSGNYNYSSGSAVNF